MNVSVNLKKKMIKMCKTGLKNFRKLKSKSNLHYTCGITPKRVTSGGVHLRGLAPGQHSSEETSQRWQAVGDNAKPCPI